MLHAFPTSHMYRRRRHTPAAATNRTLHNARALLHMWLTVDYVSPCPGIVEPASLLQASPARLISTWSHHHPENNFQVPKLTTEHAPPAARHPGRTARSMHLPT